MRTIDIRFGLATNCLTKRWSDPDEWVPMIRQEFAIQLIQFSFDQFDPRGLESSVLRYCERLRKACDRQGVHIHSTFAGLSIYSHNLLFHPLEEGRLDAFDWFRKAFRMTYELGVTATGGPIGGMDRPAFLSAERRSQATESARVAFIELLSIAKNEYGIDTFYWEQTPVEREGAVSLSKVVEFLESLSTTDGDHAATCAMCLDVGHFTSPETPEEERDPYYWIARTAEWSPIIHLQQSDGHLDRHWGFTPERNAAGIVHSDKFFDALDVSGRSEVALLLEVNHPFEEQDPIVFDELRSSILYWERAIDQYLAKRK